MTINYVLIRGAGDLASGVACSLHQAGFQVVMTETAQPTCVRRLVSFASAVNDDQICIAGICGRQAADFEQAMALTREGKIAVLVDPSGETLRQYPPLVFIDAAMNKKNQGTKITDAAMVIAIGPGFESGVDVHAVIETHRGGELGRPIYNGSALADTGIPGEVLGYTSERLLRAPAAGTFQATKKIGDPVQAGETVAMVAGLPVQTTISGILRGLLKNGLPVHPGMKVGDVHPAADPGVCTKVTDKAWAVGRGVRQAIADLERRGDWHLQANKAFIFNRLAEIGQTSQSGVMFTLLETPPGSFCHAGARLLAVKNGPVYGSLGYSYLDHAVKLRATALLQRLGEATEIVELVLPEAQGQVKIFVEPVLPAKKLIILGGGHISLPLAEIAAILGFRVVVWDDRPEFASAQRFPRAERVICAPLDEVFSSDELAGQIDSATRVVIVTRGHRQDKAWLEYVINSAACYIGMIGSLPKINATYHSLMAAGVDAAQLEKVSAPTGLDLGGQSPAEIALSIMGEIVAREHGASGLPMKEHKGGPKPWMK